MMHVWAVDVVAAVVILTRRLKMKPRKNPPPCSHQEHRKQDTGHYRRHRRSIRARRSIIVRHRTYLCCSSHSSQSEEKKIELVLGPHSDSTSLFFNGTHRICRIETYCPFASATQYPSLNPAHLYKQVRDLMNINSQVEYSECRTHASPLTTVVPS